MFSLVNESREKNDKRKKKQERKKQGKTRTKEKKRTEKLAHLRVDVRVDAQEDPRDLPRGLCRRGDVRQVELRVHVDQRAVLHGQAQLPRQLSVAVEDGALRVEARRERDLELVARDQHAPGAELLEVLQDAQVVVGLDGVAVDGVDALERVPVRREVGGQLRLRVEVERARLGLGADVVDLDLVAVEEAVLAALVEAPALRGREDRGRAGGRGGGRRGGAGADGGGGGGAALLVEEREERGGGRSVFFLFEKRLRKIKKAEPSMVRSTD